MGAEGPDSTEQTTERIWPHVARPVVFEVPALLLEESAWVDHIPFAFWLVESCRPSRIVELGTHCGVSYCAFCQVVKGCGLATRCAAVDTWKGDPQSRAYDEKVYQQLRAYHDPLYGSFSDLLRSAFDEAVGQFADGSIDLLHIDGFHEESAVRRDFEQWRPKLSDRGIVLLHDVAEHREGFGVWRVWDELAERYPHFAFRHGHGLGLLAVGSAPADPIRWLTSLTTPDADAVRRFFESRSEVVRTHLELGRVHAELGRQLARVAALEGEGARRADLEHEVDRLAPLGEQLEGIRWELDRERVVASELRRERDRLASELAQERHRYRLLRRLEGLVRHPVRSPSR